MGTWGHHQWSVEMWRLRVHGAKSYSRFRVNLELDSFVVMYGFEHVFSKTACAVARGQDVSRDLFDLRKIVCREEHGHQKASSQHRGLQRRRLSEANVSRGETAEGLLEFVDLTRESIAGTLRPSSSANGGHRQRPAIGR